MKRALKITGCILLFTLSIVIYISYIVDHNSQEISKLETKIKNHYKTKDEITSVNKYSNFYIIKTPSKVIVLSDDYKSVLEEDLQKLSNNDANQPLIYKTNKLMYEKKVLKKNKLTYEYYDAISGELIDKTTLEQQ